MDRLTSEEATSAIEYALFLGLIAAVIIATLAILGTDVLGLFQTVEGQF